MEPSQRCAHDLKTYSGHGYEVLDAVGSSDNSRLASCGGDKTVVQWDITTGQIIRRFRGHTSVSLHASIRYHFIK